MCMECKLAALLWPVRLSNTGYVVIVRDSPWGAQVLIAGLDGEAYLVQEGGPGGGAQGVSSGLSLLKSPQIEREGVNSHLIGSIVDGERYDDQN